MPKTGRARIKRRPGEEMQDLPKGLHDYFNYPEKGSGSVYPIEIIPSMWCMAPI